MTTEHQCRRASGRRGPLLLVAAALLAAACGGDGPASPASRLGDDGTDGGGGVLAGVCPDPLVIQTDWWPEAEHGGLYELIGDDHEIDADAKVVSGPMVLDGEPLGIRFEVRSGGPAIGFSAPRVQLYTDDSIHLGYTSIDGQTTAWDDLPLVAVMAPLEIDPIMVMWDPDAHPDVDGIVDIGREGIEVNVFPDEGFVEALVARGVWSADQLNPSYDGTPARFIAEGDIAQQGFASSEPYNYEFVFDDYGKAPAFELLHDVGWTNYRQAIGVRPDDLEARRPCLDRLVPIMQRAVVDFVAAPDRANAIIVEAVERFDAGWVYPAELARWSVDQQLALGLVGNGSDDVVGNLEADRIQAVIDAQVEAGIELPEGLVAEDLFTNEFIDDSIGLPDGGG